MNASNVRLTVAVLVKDDADGLAQTLHSAQALADELLVIDTGSTDNTRDVATQCGTRVIEYPWCDDFSAPRNHGLLQVRGDWVLWLDAGETLSTADAAALRERVQTGLDATKAYMLLVRPAAAPGAIAAEQIGRVRLLPRREGLRFRGRVRESLFESLDNLGITVEGLPWRIERGAREHDAQLKRRRAQRNQRLAQIELDEIGRLPQLINCLADAAQVLGETPSAIELYRECLSIEPATSSERLEAYYGLLSCLDTLGGMSQARQAQLSLCVNALEHFPLDAQLLCAMGGYLQGQNRLDLAVRAYETAFQFGRVNPLVWHLDEITAIAAVCVSRTFAQQDKPEQALAALKTAVNRDGFTPRLCRALLDLHIENGRREEALAQLEHLAIDTDQRPALGSAIRGACLASQRNWIGARAYLQSAYDAGCHDTVCFRWLCATLVNLGHISQAQELLEDWQRLQPAQSEPLRLLAALHNRTREKHHRIDRELPAIESTSPSAAHVATVQQ